MLSRGLRRTNFKYRRDQFSLDALISHALAPMDDDTMVVKPRWRKLENQILKLKGRISTVQNRMSKLGKDEAKAKQRDSLLKEIRLLEAKREKLRPKKNGADSLTRTVQFENSECLDVLPESQRLFIDVMRIPPIRPRHAWSQPWQVRRAKKPNRERC